MRADEREAGGPLADGRLALAFERRVHGGELPARRRALRPDAVLAAVKVHVLHHVAGVVDAGEAGADPEVHVREEASAARSGRARRPLPALPSPISMSMLLIAE